MSRLMEVSRKIDHLLLVSSVCLVKIDFSLVLSTSLIHGGRGWSCNIHSKLLHGASNQDKLSLYRPSGLF